MEVDSSGSIPVQAVLRLVIDKMGQSGVEDALKKQDQSFSAIENTVGRIGTGMEGVARTVAELAGVAGVGALVDKFIKVETSASNVALAMGKVTGGSGAYHGVGQEMLGVQGRTGVTVSESESALRSLAQSIGLSPKAGQAGMLAEVIAGYSKVTGMPASVLGSIVGPMLQAEGRTSSPSAAAYTLGEARANLTAFPGSQIEGMLPVVSNLATSSVDWYDPKRREGEHYSIYGIEMNYDNGRARVYVIDTGTGAVPLASDFWPDAAASTQVAA